MNAEHGEENVENVKLPVILFCKGTFYCFEKAPSRDKHGQDWMD